MEQNIVIYIGIYKTLALVGTGITSIAYATWQVASRLTKVETKVDTLESRLTNLEGRLDGAFSSRSPITLLPKGQVVLEESGLKRYIDDRKNELLRDCRTANVMSGPYDIQNAAFTLFKTHSFGQYESALKESAFRHGISMDAVRRIAGIYFRDICLTAFGHPQQMATEQAESTTRDGAMASWTSSQQGCSKFDLTP